MPLSMAGRSGRSPWPGPRWGWRQGAGGGLGPRGGSRAACEGWSERAIAMAAAELGVPAERGRIAFADGPVQMIDAWFDWIDRHMLAAFSPEQVGAMKIRERISALLTHRLETLRP